MNRVHHWLLTALAVGIVGCGQRDEAAALAVFFLDNQSAVTVQADMTSSDGTKKVSDPIAPGERMKIAEHTKFGPVDRPSTAFTKLQLIRQDTQAKVAVQDPVNDSAWLSEQQAEGTYGAVHHTWTVTDATLQH
jgi:hypothetical protein